MLWLGRIWISLSIDDQGVSIRTCVTVNMKYSRHITIFTIGDPELSAIEYVVVFVFLSSGLKCKGNR